MGLDIIIPTKGKTDYLFKCLQSIVDTTTVDFHVHIADTGSTDDEFNDMVKFIKNCFKNNNNVSLYKFEHYNFARVNNSVVNSHCKHDTLLFCNNDIHIQSDCIDKLYNIAMIKSTGTVGCRLLFENGKVQHAGQIAFTHRPNNWQHEDDKLEVTHRGLKSQSRYNDVEKVLGSTGALMCVRRDIFNIIGGFNQKYIECFEDVEFNMRVLLAGYDNMYIDNVDVTHAESVTRSMSSIRMQALWSDYMNNLFPYWCSLSENDQQFIKSFHETENTRRQLTPA